MTKSLIIFILCMTTLITKEVYGHIDTEVINNPSLINLKNIKGEPEELKPEWYWPYLQSKVSVGVLDSGDFDGDGIAEVLTSASSGQTSLIQRPKVMFILENDMKTAICEANLGNAPFDYYILQNDTDSALEIVFITKAQILIMDGRTCELEIKHDFKENISSAAIGDLNNDNVLDVAYSIDNNLYTSPWDDFSNPSEKIDFGGSKIIINSLGREGGDDIGILTNDTLSILRGDNLNIIREIDNNFTLMFDFGDINGDGVFELVQAIQSPSEVVVTNIAQGNILFSTPVSNIQFMRLTDVNNDDIHEIIVSESGLPELIYQINQTGNIINTVESPSRSIANIFMADLGIGIGNEYIWGTGNGGTAVNNLYRADIENASITRRSQDFDGPYQFSEMGDIYADGQSYLGISHDKAEFINGGVSVINLDKGLVEQKTYSNYSVPNGTLSAVTTGNIDLDPSWEICFANGLGSSQYVISCKDTITEETQISLTYRNGYIYQMKLVDLDNDSDKELLVISTNGFINSYYTDNGFLYWESEPFSNEDISLGFDGLKKIGDELWVFFLSGNIYKIDPQNGSVLESFLNTSITNVSIKNNNIYAIKQGVGIGLLNLENMDIDKGNLIYPTKDIFDFLKVSEDEKNMLLARKVSETEFRPTLISIDKIFKPWSIDTNIYDAFMPNFLQLILAGRDGAISYDLRLYHDDIFDNNFELN